MRCTGGPQGTPRIDGEQANACAKGCNACVARAAREGRPGSTVSRRMPAQKETGMPEKQTVERARRDKRQGKAASTQAGEFVKEEMDHIRQGKHGARSAKQAIAIGLSKARRSGVKLPPPKSGAASGETRRKAKSDSASASKARKPLRTRSRAT